MALVGMTQEMPGEMRGSMKLTLGPNLFNWQPDVWRDFYFRIADEASVDTVAVGEVVCSKRMPFFDEHFPAVIERLTSAGKQVLVSSLALITLERERRRTEELVLDEGFIVEVNDITCMTHLAGRSHAVGPFVNVYNEGTALWLATQDARSICLPPELPLNSVAAIAAAVPRSTSKCSHSAARRSPSRRDAITRDCTNCPRTIAVSCARPTWMGCR